MQACPVPLLLECPADAEQAKNVAVLNARLQERDAQLADARREKDKLQEEIAQVRQQLVDSQKQVVILQQQSKSATDIQK